jgi:hypothetical protein
MFLGMSIFLIFPFTRLVHVWSGFEPGVDAGLLSRCVARWPWLCGSTSYVTALRQYLRVLAGQARVEGVDLEAAETPLVQ